MLGIIYFVYPMTMFLSDKKLLKCQIVFANFIRVNFYVNYLSSPLSVDRSLIKTY